MWRGGSSGLLSRVRFGGRSLSERTGLRYPLSRIRAKKRSAAGTSRMERLTRSRRQPRVPERSSPKDSANWRASRSSVRMSRSRDLATARPSASPGPTLFRTSSVSIFSGAVGTTTSSQSQEHLGISPRLSPSLNSLSTEGGASRGEKSARRRSGLSTCAKLLRTVVSERAALIRGEPIQGRFSRAAISRRASSIEDGPMRKGTPSRKKRSWRLEARETELFRSLAEVDVGIQVPPKHLGIVGDSLSWLGGLGGAGGERLKQAEVGGVQQDDLFLARAFEHGHFPVAHTLHDLTGLGPEVHRGDHCSGHGCHPSRLYNLTLDSAAAAAAPRRARGGCSASS